MYQGFMQEGVASTFLFLIRNDSETPIEPDAAPTWRLYSAAGGVSNGDGTAASLESGTVTGASNASPISITSASHGLITGQRVTIASVGGNTAANGTFVITRTGTNTFTLNGSTGNASYTSGGTWKTTGLYKVTLTGAVLSGLEAGKTYVIVLYWSVSGTQKSESITFTVR